MLHAYVKVTTTFRDAYDRRQLECWRLIIVRACETLNLGVVHSCFWRFSYEDMLNLCYIFLTAPVEDQAREPAIAKELTLIMLKWNSIQ